MFFGLRNGLATFQRAMNVVLATVKWQYALLYINDIIEFSKTPKGHLYDIEEALRLVNLAKRTVTLRNCSMF